MIYLLLLGRVNRKRAEKREQRAETIFVLNLVSALASRLSILNSYKQAKQT